MNVNFMKVHQPNLPHPDFIHKSMSKSKYADSVVELDARIGRIMDKLRALGLDKNTLVFYTTDNGAWQDVYPDAGYTPFRGTKGTVREGGNRVPAIAWMPGKIEAGVEEPRHRRRPRPDGDLRRGRPASKLPENDREGKPIIFDSYDMSPVLFGTGKSRAQRPGSTSPRTSCRPGAARVGNYKAVFNLRGDDGAATGGLAVDSNLGWKGAEKYVATVPQVFDLWQDPQERYDIFMNNFTERTWMGVVMGEELKKLMETYVKYPPRKLQSVATPARSRSRTTRNSSGFGIRWRRTASACRCRPATERRNVAAPRGHPPAAQFDTICDQWSDPMRDASNHLNRRTAIAARCSRQRLSAARQRCAQADPLPSWNDGAAKQAIVDFVARVTTQGGPDFVPRRSAHRHLRQRRHALDRAADVRPARLHPRPRQGAGAAASRTGRPSSRSRPCSTAT